MAASQEYLDKMKARQNYRNVWHTDLLSTITADAPYCCFSLLCGPCVSYLLRKRALYNDMSRYTCCAGYMPCSGKCGESKCPELCLCTEVFCCFGNSVASTRFLLQDEFNIQTTQCDNCIIGFMFCLQQLACICSIVACLVGSDELSDASQALNCLADVVYCTVCACMQAMEQAREGPEMVEMLAKLLKAAFTAGRQQGYSEGREDAAIDRPVEEFPLYGQNCQEVFEACQEEFDNLEVPLAGHVVEWAGREDGLELFKKAHADFVAADIEEQADDLPPP